MLFTLFLSCSIVSIVVRFKSCQLPSCNLFTSHSCFIVFWERDITSELHGTPVHISTIVTPSLYFLFLLSCCNHNYFPPLCFDPLQTTRPEGLTTPLYSLGAKLLIVCAGQGQVSNPLL